MKTNNICIFPGTFNPIHNGHIKMADYVLKKYKFDKIIFIPAYLPPHKEISKNLAEHRINMVKIATSFNPKFEVSDIEYRSNGISYSLNTVVKIRKLYGIKNRLNFIIGTDAFSKLDSWYHTEELKDLVHFLVFRRKGDNIKNLEDQFYKNGWSFEITQADYIDISSTCIRNGFSNETNIKVKDYIKSNELYEN